MIENLINHKKYIGQSINIKRRWKEHINNIKKVNNTHLYNAFRKYGIENFTFTIIEECLQENLNNKEKYWIKYYNSLENGYNENSGGNQNVIFSELHKKNLSIARQKNKSLNSKITENLWLNEEYREKVIKNREKAQHNSKPVIVYCHGSAINVFPTIWQCTKWLIEEGYGNNFEQIRCNVRKHLKRNSQSFMKKDIQIRYL